MHYTHLVDSSGDTTLKLHLEQLAVGRVLLQRALQTADLVLHPNDGHLQRGQLNLHGRSMSTPRNGDYTFRKVDNRKLNAQV